MRKSCVLHSSLPTFFHLFSTSTIRLSTFTSSKDLPPTPCQPRTMDVSSLPESSHLNKSDWLGHAWTQYLVGFFKKKNYTGGIRNYITSIRIIKFSVEDALSYATWNPNDLYFWRSIYHKQGRPCPTKTRVLWVPCTYVWFRQMTSAEHRWQRFPYWPTLGCFEPGDISEPKYQPIPTNFGSYTIIETSWWS